MKNLSKGMLMAALITGMFGCASAYAAEEVQEFSLDPMIVTAQRTETKDLDTPASVTVVTSEEIQNSGAKTAYEIIERQVGFTNKAYGTGGREFGGSSSRTNLRGLDKGTLVMVNGAPLNLLNYNSMEGIPTAAIEKIEIVRGAQSTLYGAEAFGGVVNIITKKGGKAKTTISGGIGNFDKKWSLNSVGEKYVVSIAKDYYGHVNELNKKFPGKASDGKTKTRYALRNSTKDSAFVSISPIDNVTVNYAHTEGRYYRDGWTLDKDTKEKTGAGTSYFYDDVRDNISAIYDDKENRFKSAFTYNRRSVTPKSASIKNFKYQTLASSNSSNWNLHSYNWDTQKGWKLRNEKDDLVVGFTYMAEKAIDRTNSYTTPKYSRMDGSRKTGAIYASYKYAATDNFNVTLGMRGVRLTDDAKNQNVFLPQIQTDLKLNDTTAWYINVGKAFQMPAVNAYFQYPKADYSSLKPQIGWTYETGIKIINDNTSIKADVFHMDVDSKFGWERINPSLPISSDNSRMVNTGKFKNTGVEVEFAQQLSDKFNYRLGMMYGNPKTKEEGSNFYKQSDDRFQLTAGVDYKIGKLTSNLNYLYIGKRQASYYDQTGTKYEGKAGQLSHKVPFRSILNANFTYKADEHHTWSLSMNNLLGRKDCINEYENWSMPYNWMVNYSFSF